MAGLATFEIYAAIPAGFAFGLHPGTIFGASLVGGLAGVFIAAFLGDKIKAFFSRFFKPKESKPKEGLIYRIWHRYGVIGVGFLGTMTVGAPLSLAVGVGFNVPLKSLVGWCCLGVLVRCVVFTTVGHYGLSLFQ